MGGFFSMEQNVRRNAMNGAVAPKLNANRNAVNVEVANNGTRRNNGNNGRNTSRRNGNNVAVNMGSVGTSDPEELEEVVVNSRPNSPANTGITVNRPNNRNNRRINVVATNVQAPLPANTTPEGEEQVGGKRKGKSRRSKRSRHGKSKRARAA